MCSENTQDIVEKHKIIHIDMDAFYASVEQRDHPEFRNKPVIVGGTPEQRGVVAACSYEARRFGIHSAMSAAKAQKLCPDAIFLRPRFSVYRQVSIKIHDIFQSFTELVEPLSLDEAYLDVTQNREFSGSASLIAKEIKRRIKRATGLNASAGVSYNKFLAKVASDMDKPDGLYLITPEQGPDFVKSLPIRKFFGIGKATEAKMKALAIHNGADLRQRSLEHLMLHFGKAGKYYYNIARGIDNRPVNNQRIRKSLGKETTFEHDMADRAQMYAVIEQLANQVAAGLKEKQLVARTVTLKVKYADFEQVTRSQTAAEGEIAADQIAKIAQELLAKTEAGRRKIRLLGVSTSNLGEQMEHQEEQMNLL